jgi:coenzyme F420-reducing hydrogenase delta subunit
MLMRSLLAHNGIEPGRFHARWISGSEAAKFRDTVAEVAEMVKSLGPNPIREDGSAQSLAQSLGIVAAAEQGGTQ